jgi:hypothetical protein
MFRSHKPDGLDDYTQDFSQPELLPAALSAGLRNWLVEQATAPDGEAPHSTAAAPEPATVAATAITSEPQRLADNHSQTPPTIGTFWLTMMDKMSQPRVGEWSIWDPDSLPVTFSRGVGSPCSPS